MSQQTASLQVKSLDHVTLIVKDLDRSQQFYVDSLGMQLVDRPGFSFPGLWFQAGNTQIHLILEHADSGAAGGEDHTSSRNRHFAFEVADGNVAADRLQELGIAIVSGPVTRPDGARQVFVNDPDGHLVELCSPPT